MIFNSRITTIIITWMCFALGLFAPGALAQQQTDTLRTIDGRNFSGTVTFGAGHVQIRQPQTATQDFKLTDLAEIRMARKPLATAGDETQVRHGLKVEYFSDPGFKSLRYVRLDKRLDFVASSDVPTLACENDYSIRWSGRFVTDVAGTYSLKVVGDGLRSVVLKIKNDGKTPLPKLDPTGGFIECKSNVPVDFTVDAIGVTPYASIILLWGRGSSSMQIVPTEHLLPPVDFTDAAWRDWLKTDQGAGLLAQYFDGPQFDKPSLTVLEPYASAGERGPRRSVTTAFGIRWSGQLELPATGAYELSISSRVQQPIRMWIDGKQVLNFYSKESNRKSTYQFIGEAGQKLDLRIETSRTEGRGGDDVPLLLWSGPNWKTMPVHRDHFYPPAKIPIPWLIFPPTNSGQEDFLKAEVLLAGPAANGSFLVDVINPEGRVLATAKEAPYRLTLPLMVPEIDPATKAPKIKGELKPVREIMIRVSDTKGNINVSNILILPQRSSTTTSLGSGWLASTIGRMWNRIPLPKRVTPKTVELPGTGGEIFQTTDSLHFFYQPLAGQGNLQTQLQVTEAPEEKAATTGGIMIRDEIDTRSRYIGLFASRGKLALIRRDRAAALPSLSTVPDVTIPCWIKLTRHNGRIIPATSQDGKVWNDISIDPMLVYGTAFAGICNLGKGQDIATFDSLSLQNLGTEDSAFPPGIQLISGSVLGGKITEITGKSITFTHPGLDAKQLARGDVARIFLRSIPPTALENLQGRLGVLLPQGDIFEGNLTSLTIDKVGIESTIFGPRQFTSDDAAGLLLKEISPPSNSTRYEIQLTDGSKLLADDLKIDLNLFVISESRFGPVKLPFAEVIGIRRIVPQNP